MFKSFMLVMLMASGVYAMTQQELAIAIDHSVRQSVRTQKMVKEALLIKMGIEPQANAKRMQFTVNMLNKDLNAFLGRGEQKYKHGIKLPVIKDKKILSLIKDFEDYWRPIEKRAKEINSLKNVSSDNVKFLVEHNIEFLHKNRAVVLALTKLSKEGNNKLKLANDIKIAGKQRMLLQMISKDILMYINDIQKQDALKDLKKITQVNRNFKALFNGDKELGCIGVKLPKIVKQLKIAQKEWSSAKPQIVKVLRKKDKTQIKELIAKLDRVRVSMRKAVILYTLSINRQKEFLALNKIINSFENRGKKTKNLVDLSGKLRMLTQRISKNAIECTYNLRANSCSIMEGDIKLYSNILKLFEVGSKKLTIEPKFFKNAKGQIVKLKELWTPFKDNANRFLRNEGKDKKALEYVLANNELILQESDKLVKLLLKYNSNQKDYIKQKMIRVANIAGKERMLTQKMTKELLEYKVLHSSSKKEGMQKSIATFDLILRVLFNGNEKLQMPKVTNLQIKKQLQKVSNIWSKLKPNYLKDDLSNKKLHLILIANPIVLKEMDKTVQMITKATEY